MKTPLSFIQLSIAVLAFLGFLASPAAAQTGGERNPEDAIKEFRSRIARPGATQNDVSAAFKSLDLAHPAVLKELLRWASLPFVPKDQAAGFAHVGGEDDRPNCLAATRIGELFHDDPEAARGLVRVIKARAQERIRPGTLADLYRAHDFGWLLDRENLAPVHGNDHLPLRFRVPPLLVGPARGDKEESVRPEDRDNFHGGQAAGLALAPPAHSIVTSKTFAFSGRSTSAGSR